MSIANEAMSDQEKDWLYKAMSGTDFFAACSMGEIENLIAGMEKKHFRKGDKIVKQGEIGEFFFMLGRGRVSVWVRRKGIEPQRVNILGPGSYFGEIALMREVPRTATIVAEEDCEAFLLYRSNFREIVLDNAALERKMEATVNKRLEEQDKQLSHAPKAKGFLGKLFGK